MLRPGGYPSRGFCLPCTRLQNYGNGYAARLSAVTTRLSAKPAGLKAERDRRELGGNRDALELARESYFTPLFFRSRMRPCTVRSEASVPPPLIVPLMVRSMRTRKRASGVPLVSVIGWPLVILISKSL